MASVRFAGFVLACASAGLLALSAASLVGEGLPYSRSGFAPELRFAAIADGEYEPSLSFRSKDSFFKDCFDIGDSIYAAAQSSAKRSSFFDACLNAASLTTQAMPLYARAWLASALASAELRDFESMNASLLRARATAPHVTYLAERRVALAVRYFGELGSAQRDAFDEDLVSLLSTRTGLTTVAELYVANSDHRDRIKRILETMPENVQAAFISQAKRAL